MLDSKLAKIRDLIAQKEKIDAELDALLGGVAPVKRGRPNKKAAPEQTEAELGGAA